MEVHELVIEMKLLERRLTLYEEKYGVLSEDFHAALTSGQLADYDAYDESRSDFSRWKGIYETLCRRKNAYRKQLEGRELTEVLRVQPPINDRQPVEVAERIQRFVAGLLPAECRECDCHSLVR